MIDHRRNTVVRRDRQKLRLELFALADVDRKDLVTEPGLFEEHRDLVAVRRGPVVKVDHGSDPRCEKKILRIAKNASEEKSRKMRMHEFGQIVPASQWPRHDGARM